VTQIAVKHPNQTEPNRRSQKICRHYIGIAISMYTDPSHTQTPNERGKTTIRTSQNNQTNNRTTEQRETKRSHKRSPRRTLVWGLWILDTGCGILNTGYWILDSRFWGPHPHPHHQCPSHVSHLGNVVAARI